MIFDCGEMSILERAVDTYGVQSQISKTIEEMAELTKELCKDTGSGERVDLIAWKDAKVDRLRLRLEAAKCVSD